MTTLDAAFTDRNSEILARPAAANPASFGEIFRAEWQAAGLDTMSGVGKPWQEAADELESTFRTLTGESVFDAATRKGVKLPGSSFEGRAEAVRQLAGDLDLDQRRVLEPLFDLRGRARSKAAAIEKQAQDVEDRTYGLSGHAVAFLAGVARQSVDPVNLATLPLGAARGASILRMLATEGGIGLATQAAQEPFIQAGRAELGLEAGFGQAVSNSLEAGLGAAGFAGLLRGAGFLARRAFAPDAAIEPAAAARVAGTDATGGDLAAAAARAGEPAPRAPEVPGPGLLEVRTEAFDPALGRALADLDPDDFQAAAHLVERDAVIERMAPVDTDEARMLHQQGLDIATGALETGRLADLDDALSGALGEPFVKAVRRSTASRPVNPLSLSQFIARNGGLELSPDAQYHGFDKVFVPGGGPLARKSGRSIDGFWRERLIEEGYLPKDEDGYLSRDIRDELVALLQAEQRGQRSFAAADQARAAELAAANIDIDRDIEIAAQEIIAANREFGGGEIDTRSLYEAAELLHSREVTDPIDALERAYVRQVLNEELPAAAKAEYALSRSQEDSDAIQRGAASQDGGSARGGGAGRAEPGSRQGAGGEGQDGTRAGGGGAEPGQGRGLDAGGSDPQASARLADVERAMAANGGDLDLFLPGPDGQTIKTTAKAELARIEAEANAARELKACLGGGP